MPSHRSIVARTYDAFNARDFAAYRELLDDDVELVMAGVTVRGIASVTEFVSLTATARPGLRIEPERVFAQDGDTVVTEVRMIDALAEGAADDPPPTQARACGLYRLADDRITEWRIYLDPAGEALASAALMRIAAEQTALRQVAEKVARNAPLDEVLSTVASELMRLLEIAHVRGVRCESDQSVTVISARGSSPDVFGLGSHPPATEGTVMDRVLRTGRPARVQDYSTVAGPAGELLRAAGIGAVAGAPILVEGQVWGGIVVAGTLDDALPAQAEALVGQFADLVSMAISSVEARASIERLATDQSALRRVATLVAREVPLQELFPSLAGEVRRLLGVDVVAITAEGDVAPIVVDTGGGVPAADWDAIRADPQLDWTACAIVADGAEWGAITIAARSPQTMEFDAATRLSEFARHAGMAVAAEQRRVDLTQSRARIVRAADDARHGFERDLHDGVQQQLISLALALGEIQQRLPPGADDARGALTALGARLQEATDSLRELSHGLHPTILSEDGLAPALRMLVRRSATPARLQADLTRERYERPVEVTAYYVVSEALANAAKHARASRVEIELDDRAGTLLLTVRDDGRGGADPAAGSGLTGLVDRVEAIGGTISIQSPPAHGTAIAVRLPLSLAGR